MFPDRLRALREAHGLTRAELSAALHVHSHYLYLLETGRRTPSHKTLRKVAAYFHVPVGLFFRPTGIAGGLRAEGAERCLA